MAHNINRKFPSPRAFDTDCYFKPITNFLSHSKLAQVQQKNNTIVTKPDVSFRIGRTGKKKRSKQSNAVIFEMILSVAKT